MRGYNDARFQDDKGAQLLQHTFSCAVAIIGADVGMTVLVAGERRMQHAVDLLHQGALKISEVALRVGYRSEAAFIRRFVEQFGITPGRMRATFQPYEESLQVAL